MDKSSKITYRSVIGLVLAATAVLMLLSLTASHNPYHPGDATFVLFHTLAELFTVAVAAAAFMIVWNARQYLANNFLGLIGISMAAVALLDTLHTVAYKGIALFGVEDAANRAAQLWLMARYIQAAPFVAAPFFFGRRMSFRWALAIVAALSAAMLLLFHLNLFPTAYIVHDAATGVGRLTIFKILSEIAVIAGFAFGIAQLWLRRRHFSPEIVTGLTIALLLMIGTETLFTLYSTVDQSLNVVAHMAKFLAFLLIYKVMVEAGLSRPYTMLFHSIKQHEKALAESERRYRQLVEQSPDPILVQRDDEIIYVNPAAVHMFAARDADELLGRSLAEFIAVRSRELFSEQIEHLTRYRGQVTLRDIQIHQLTGDVAEVEATAANIIYSGEPAAQIVLRDVTERRRAEEHRSRLLVTLQQERERAEKLAAVTQRHAAEMDAIISSLAEPLLLYNTEGLVVQANPAAVQDIGFDPVGMHRQKLRERIEIMPLSQPVEQTVTHCCGSMQSTRNSYRNHAGEERISLLTEAPIIMGETNIGCVATWRDITDRESLLRDFETGQARLNAIIESAPEGIMVANEKGEIVLSNPAAEAIMETPRKDAADASSPQICYADGSPYIYRDQPLMRSVHDGAVQTNIEIALIWPDGERRDLLANSAPIFDSHGRISGGILIVQDISRQYTFKATLARRAEQLETLIREAHHRIRNNLQSVISLLELERMRLSDDGGLALDRCVSRVKAIATVHKLLTKQATSEVPVQNLLEALSELGRSTYLDHRMRQCIQMSVKGPNMPIASQHATSLAIVVNELITNAIQHAFDGREDGRIEIVVQPRPDGQLAVEVCDNGVGCPENVQMGTGLTLTRTIVEHDLKGRFRMVPQENGSKCEIIFTAGL